MLAMLLAASLAAPVPKAKAVELYYPTVEGSKRVMRITAGGRTSETTESVTKVVEKDGTYTVTISRDLAGRAVEFTNEVSAKGVFSVSTPTAKSTEPVPLLKLTAKEGDTWTRERPGPDNTTLKVTCTVGQEEEVEVPAGKFKAIPVTGVLNADGRILKTTAWYAAGVGVVKSVAEGDRTERVEELKEFSPAK